MSLRHFSFIIISISWPPRLAWALFVVNEQLPLLELREPGPSASTNDPDVVTVRWQTRWLRFDGKPYTSECGPTFNETESHLIYRVLWSDDEGLTWTSPITGLTELPDRYPERLHERLTDVGIGAESYTFALPSTVRAGDVVIAVEAWRRGTYSHNASHRARLFVRRTP